jgi:ribonuclease P/MRP protein subunit RPP40
MDRWTAALETGNSVDCIYMDFAKAFDTVPHRRPISKLLSYGFSTEMVNWIASFLADRVQQMTINEDKSKWKDVASVIPQGSVLGPIFFVLYINDLPDEVDSDLFLFADDTKIISITKTRDDVELLQKDLKTLENWSNSLLLEFHPDKCKKMHIGKPGPCPEQKYSLMGTYLHTCDVEKDIGVYIDQDLSFDRHIGEKVKKANYVRHNKAKLQVPR